MLTPRIALGFRRPTVAAIAAILALIPTGTLLTAQTPPTAPPAAAPATPPAAAPAPVPIRIGPVTIAGSLRLRAEGWDWFTTPGFDDTYLFGGSLLRVGATYTNPRLDVMAELSQPTLIGLPETAVAPAPQGQLGLGASYRAPNGEQKGTLFLKQAFVRLKFGSPVYSVRAGRIDFWDGSETAPADASLGWVKRERVAHRLLGNFGFSHVQRSFDAVQFVRNTPTLNLTLLGGMPTRGVFTLDAQGTIEDIDVVYASATLPSPTRDLRAFFLQYEDSRGLIPTDNRPAPVRTADREAISISTIGGHVIQALPTSSGPIDLMAWGAYQFGDWGSQEHSAYAFAGEAGFQPTGLPLRPWIRAGYFAGSGDTSAEGAAGGEHESFFQLLPTPRIYARTPFHNLMNSEDIFVQLLLRPDTRTNIRLDLRSLALAEGTDLWYAGGGAFDEVGFGFAGRPSGGDTDFASVIDLSVDRTLGAMTSASLYLGRVSGGDVISRIYPEGATANYVYLELTRRF